MEHLQGKYGSIFSRLPRFRFASLPWNLAGLYALYAGRRSFSLWRFAAFRFCPKMLPDPKFL
jgi:hypothetical protein